MVERSDRRKDDKLLDIFSAFSELEVSLVLLSFVDGFFIDSLSCEVKFSFSVVASDMTSSLFTILLIFELDEFCCMVLLLLL